MEVNDAGDDSHQASPSVSSCHTLFNMDHCSAAALMSTHGHNCHLCALPEERSENPTRLFLSALKLDARCLRSGILLLKAR